MYVHVFLFLHALCLAQSDLLEQTVGCSLARKLQQLYNNMLARNRQLVFRDECLYWK